MGLAPTHTFFYRYRTGDEDGVPTTVDLDETVREDAPYSYDAVNERVDFVGAMDVNYFMGACGHNVSLPTGRQWFFGEMRKNGVRLVGSQNHNYLFASSTDEDRESNQSVGIEDVDDGDSLDVNTTGRAAGDSKPTNATQLILMATDAVR